MKYTRREALGLAGGAFAVSALTPGMSHAISDPVGTWGRPDPAIYPANFFPTGQPRYKILEVHLYGGMSPWETFYHRPLAGGAGFRGFHVGASEVTSALSWHSMSSSMPDLCSLAPTSAGDTTLFSNASGHTVHFGPSTRPIWGSILGRTRVVTQQHNLLPHEAAIPYAATGFRLGQPNLAGLGASIQRRAFEIEKATHANLADRRTTPWSYVFEPSLVTFPNDNLDAFKAVGTHGGSAKPVTLFTDGGGIVARLEDRRNAPDADRDALMQVYRAQYERALTFPGHMGITRSRGFEEFAAAMDNALNADQLAALFGSTIENLGQDQTCVTVAQTDPRPVMNNHPVTGLRSAAALLSHPTTPAHYACVIDGGLITAPGGGGYDTHNSRQSSVTSTNLWNVLASIRQLVDTGQIDLDETMIVLTTEFGRTPFRSSGGSPSSSSNGRDHWPQGYVNVLIGGPIQAQKLLGEIQDGDLTGGSATDNGIADPTDVYNATDVRAAALLAAGIDPFADGLFGGSDVSPSLRGADNHATATNIVNRFFR